MLYSKIVVAYDGSEISDRALDSAIKMAKLNHFAKLEIIHVINLPSYVVGDTFYTPPAKEDGEVEFYNYTERIIDKIKEKLNPSAAVHIEVRRGSPARTILQYAEETGAALIVIGSRGMNSLGEFVLGSVSHNVVQHAKVPVLVVK